MSNDNKTQTNIIETNENDDSDIKPDAHYGDDNVNVRLKDNENSKGTNDDLDNLQSFDTTNNNTNNNKNDTSDGSIDLIIQQMPTLEMSDDHDIGQESHSRIADYFDPKEPSYSLEYAANYICHLILFSLMICYMVYQGFKYFDSDYNYQETVEIVKVDSIPFPYIYIDFKDNFDNSNTCPKYVWFGYVDNSPYYDLWFYRWNTTDYNDNMTIEQVFEAIDTIDQLNANDNNCTARYIHRYYGSYSQYLLIPSSGCRIPENTKDYLYVWIYNVCNDNSTNYWRSVGHRESLHKYDTLSNAFENLFYYESEFSRTGYWVQNTYQWYSFDDTINNGDGSNYDFFAFSNDKTYILDWYENDYSGTLTRETFSPSDVAMKTIFLTEQLLDVFDILGLAGGTYTSLKEIFTQLLKWVVWGFAIGGCVCVKGLSTNSGPDGVLRQQIVGMLRRRDLTITKLARNMKEKSRRMNELERRIDTLLSNS